MSSASQRERETRSSPSQDVAYWFQRRPPHSRPERGDTAAGDGAQSTEHSGTAARKRLARQGENSAVAQVKSKVEQEVVQTKDRICRLIGMGSAAELSLGCFHGVLAPARGKTQ